MDSFSETFYENFEDVIESQSFLIVCYAIFVVALFVYLYTGYLMCNQKELNWQGFKLNGCTQENVCKTSSNSTEHNNGEDRENWLTSSKGQYSPLNIVESIDRQCSLEQIIWKNHGTMPNGMLLKNNGKTAVLYAIYSCNKPSVFGVGLPNEYTFVQLSFRWGLHCNSGADHMLNGEKFPLEMQALYRFGTEGSELPSHSMLVIAFLFKHGGYSMQLEPIVQSLRLIRRPNSKAKISAVPLNSIIPIHNGGFFCYIGSMTEPPYYEGVKWLVYSKSFAVSKAQLEEFYQLLGPDMMPIEQAGRSARRAG